MDVGFQKAGFQVVWANEIDKHAAGTYRASLGEHLSENDIVAELDELRHYRDEVDCVIGGPPCQGFSVAGKMDLNDPRSSLVRTFLDVVAIVQPRLFVMENVKSLATLNKFSEVRKGLMQTSAGLGYSAELFVLNSRHFNTPQSRERMFLVGIKDRAITHIECRTVKYRQPEVCTREAIQHLGPAGTQINPLTCKANITLAARPVLRKSPYAGMLFNGAGRPINPEMPSPTLPASMGGNKTPIIDERHYYEGGASWTEEYHTHLMTGGAPYNWKATPPFLRRLTIEEARVLHTFPDEHKFVGPMSSVYKQIGNAVPCNLAEAVARAAIDELEERPLPNPEDHQGMLFAK